MTTLETRIAALRVIEKIIVLDSNVKNGCIADRAELEAQLPRLEAIKKWAIENDQLQNIKSWFCDKNFGQHLQFSATKISQVFYN